MNTEQFYPTPRKLLESIFSDTDWKRIVTVLEPSAGNGDICDYIMEKAVPSVTASSLSELIDAVENAADGDVIGIDSKISIDTIPEEIPELLSYMEEVMPRKEKKETSNEDNKADVFDIVADMDKFLPNKKEDS